MINQPKTVSLSLGEFVVLRPKRTSGSKRKRLNYLLQEFETLRRLYPEDLRAIVIARHPDMALPYTCAEIRMAAIEDDMSSILKMKRKRNP